MGSKSPGKNAGFGGPKLFVADGGRDGFGEPERAGLRLHHVKQGEMPKGARMEREEGKGEVDVERMGRGGLPKLEAIPGWNWLGISGLTADYSPQVSSAWFLPRCKLKVCRT